jgi:hypothetical protein
VRRHEANLGEGCANVKLHGWLEWAVVLEHALVQGQSGLQLLLAQLFESRDLGQSLVVQLGKHTTHSRPRRPLQCRHAFLLAEGFHLTVLRPPHLTLQAGSVPQQTEFCNL